MHISNTVLFASAAFAAGSYAAMPDVTQVHALVRSVTVVEHPRNLQRRDDCSNAANDFASVIQKDPPPVPDDKYINDLESYVQSHDIPTPTGCEAPKFTGSLGDEYTSYSSEFMDWWKTHSTDFQSIYSACSTDADLSSSIALLATGCTSLLADVTGSPKSGGDDSSSDKGSDNSNDDKDDAAPRNGAAAVAALGVAGLVAAIL